MGSAMAARLIELGREVSVWNRSPAKAEPLIRAGARQAATPAELAGQSEILLVMLLNDAASEEVYRGSNGLLSAPLSGRLVIDCSTVQPALNVAHAADVAAAGADFVECPVGGTVGPARQGKLFGFAGGTPQAMERAMPLLSQLCRRIEHVGAVGAGSTLKLAVNLPLLVYWQALGESLAICKGLGLPPERLTDILADTSGAAAAMKLRAPDVAKLMAGGELANAAFTVSAARKDLATAVQFAQTQHTEIPVAASALSCFEQVEAAGLGDADAISVPVFWAEGAGRS
jgi:3-hydroxyisobutyrate dehydrogenase